MEERGSLENVLEGLGELVFDKEVLGRSFFWVCVHVIEYFGFVLFLVHVFRFEFMYILILQGSID